MICMVKEDERMAAKKKFEGPSIRTIVAMEKSMYDAAVQRAWSKHTTFSGLVRDLLECELRKKETRT